MKVLWWFLLASRLQRLYMSQHTVSHMRWHAHGRTKDDMLRHPADGETRRAFDTLHLDFALDPCNVRLELASHDFNYFGNTSTSHSTWHVMLVPYNLHHGMCTKQPDFIFFFRDYSKPNFTWNEYRYLLITSNIRVTRIVEFRNRYI
jgi:hypothetical protein